jgi:hypothetical protein
VRPLRTPTLAIVALAIGPAVAAQQLEPRAYSPAPVGTNIFGLGLLDMRGDVVTDPSLPLDDVSAHLDTFTPYYGRTFALAGRSASFTMVTPYAWGHARGLVYEQEHVANRSGFGDPLFRLAVNLIGGPAMTPREFATRERRPTLGASLVVNCPFGEYDSSKLVNLGTNRWAFKPELGLSVPAGRWDLEVYGAAWLFAPDADFFGGQHRTQAPLWAAQTHIVYTVHPGMWAALDFTYYWGGNTTLDGVRKDDRLDNTRGGITLATPIVGRQSLKVSWTRGVSTRIGSSFQTFGVAWQWVWFDRPKPPGDS